MEHHERADELEKEADRLEEGSSRLGEDIEDVRSDWEAKKSDQSTPGAATEEGSGPHHIEGEDPATGERKGEEREAERREAVEDDAE
jgi:hypothetical protein